MYGMRSSCIIFRKVGVLLAPSSIVRKTILSLVGTVVKTGGSESPPSVSNPGRLVIFGLTAGAGGASSGGLASPHFLTAASRAASACLSCSE